jgi:FtsP/CotA-like multicopper oxidase with cupredoxin domain
VREFSRRQFLASASAAGIVGAAASSMSSFVPPAIAAAPEPMLLRVASRTIAVNGKPAKVLGLLQPDGRSGIVVPAGQFRVRLENQIDAPTLIHWHGLLPPYGQDGVPDLPQPLLPPGRSYDYDFPLATPGTHWMHAHTLQEQQLLAAPLIVTDPAEDAADEQPVVVLFHDFSFKTPEELLAGLVGASGMSGMAGMGGHAGHGGMAQTGDMSGMMNQDMSGMDSDMAGGMAMDINDIDYDAYLANDRALDDPEVFRVEPGGIVRLRLINGATATAFWIDLGVLTGEAIAVDGNPIVPVAGQRFPLAMGQRIDIRIRLPQGQGAWPILALREGAVERTGFVLATRDGTVEHIAATSAQAAPVLDLLLENSLRAARPLPERPADRPEAVVIGGDMASYVWTLDGRIWGQHRPIAVKAGEQVEVALRNRSMMGHPIHLHGHHFQVVAIDGKRLAGAVRDTVWLPPMREVTIAFDAGNPGTWAFHCHHLYHMATGMMTVVDYTA